MSISKNILRAVCFIVFLAFAPGWSHASPQSAPSIQGDYIGAIGPLILKLHLKAAPDGTLTGTLDSSNQGAHGIPCADFHLDGQALSFRVPSVNGSWKGTIENNGATLSGTWWQGTLMPLTFTREAPALDPVSPADMESVLRRDLKKTFSTGLLASGKPTGVVVGVMRNGERRVFALGTARPDSVFEIGSITKTFTGLLLAQLIEQGKVRPETPVRELLPKDTVEKPPDAEITLLDLVTQHSGLPRMPDNFKPADPANPYADYRADNLYQFIHKQGVAKPANPRFLYSNLGLGLLGQALANSADVSYPELLKRSVLEPLKLHDTSVALSPDQQRRFMPPYSADLRAAHAWDLVSFAGAGAIRSTADDMLKYLEANLHPETSAAKSAADDEARTLPAALARTHELRADAAPGMRVGYAWLYDTSTGNYWHNGGTGGFTSYAFFNPKGNYAAVVLVNVALSERGSFADVIGHYISQRLAGRTAISLENW